MEPCIIIHGGCRPIPAEFKEPYKQGVQLAARKGYAVLLEGGSALEAVEEAVRNMEDNPLFNAGRGCALTEENTAELDALIMDGHNLAAGEGDTSVEEKERESQENEFQEETLTHSVTHVFEIRSGSLEATVERNLWKRRIKQKDCTIAALFHFLGKTKMSPNKLKFLTCWIVLLMDYYSRTWIIRTCRDLGAVACVRGIANPVSLARRVMEDTPHCLLAGEGALKFAKKIGFPVVEDPLVLITAESYDRSANAANYVETVEDYNAGNLKQTDSAGSSQGFDTVGAVAFDSHGQLASATSTGVFPISCVIVEPTQWK
ncbi:Isoaspartyl peptidase/L-asparaginase [Stylophora pistillata]|uniref:Isoaspartyl peptidase/L-asparaginase n=1 Tax=Stylophora pistillata TaxID=50429 RepID=A0A2B4RTY1_STYPI|nr:Isoaspartyl peptidase/L-asparaginase [Stylophora pistillata]